MRIALIPARGGSKRIPRKNIKTFHGQPIIAYSINAAKHSGLFDHVIVSTDDEEIAEVAKDAGAEIPFMRPAKLSDDYATTMDVLAHAAEFYKNSGAALTDLCCLYATAPFVRPVDLIESARLFDDPALDYVFSATEFPFPIQRAFYRDKNGRTAMFQPEHVATRSQDLTPAFHDAGQFYWCKAGAVTARRPIFSDKSMPYILPRKRVQDIDTPEDWDFAEALYKLTDHKAPAPDTDK